MKYKLDLFNNLIVLSGLFSFVITLIFSPNFAEGYFFMTFFPLFFVIIYILLLQPLRFSGYRFLPYGIILMQWIKMVLMPPVCSIAGDDVGFFYINPEVASIELAIILITYEFLATSLFSFLWLKLVVNKKTDEEKNHKYFLKGNRLVYLMYLILTLVVIFTIGRSNNLLNFLIIPLTGGGRIGDVTETKLVLARQIIIIGLFLVFLLTTSWSKKKFEITNNSKYVNIAILAAFLNLAFIVGERRTSQVYTALVTIWVLSKSFPKYKKRIYYFIGISAFSVLFFMSIYKFFAAYQHNSYFGALQSSNIDFAWFSRTLQSYFFGPENVAITVDFKNNSNLGIGNIIFDYLRSTFGVSFLLKDGGDLTSKLFNTFVYKQPMATGHVLSAVGYGYLYFGFILSPIISISNIIIASLVEKKMHKSSSYEMSYIWGYILVRFITNLYVNTPPLISYATMTLGTGGLLFMTSILLKSRRNKSYSMREA